MRRLALSLASFLLAAGMYAQSFFPAQTIYANPADPGRTVVYPEGFMVGGAPLSFSGAREYHIRNGENRVVLQSGDVQSGVELSVVFANPADIQAKTRATVLCFGESTTEIRCKDPRDAASRPRNWVMLSQDELPSNVRLVGNIGHGGWSSYTYLQWPCAAKLDPNTPKSFFKPETMWYALGLKTVTGEDYNGSPDQKDLIVRTPFGFHPMDGHSSLWELVQYLGTRDNYPEFRMEGNYTGSKDQIEALRDWAEDLMYNPINEFYDRKTAQGGDHAFSLAAFLKRKHCSAPTHAVVNIGINDGDAFGSLECIAECMEKLLLCLGDIPVAHFVNRWPGVCDKSLWPGYLPRQYDINGNTANLLALQEYWRRIAASHSNISELDVWHTQFPASQFEESFGGGVLDCSKNDVHTGYEGIRSAAWQVVLWLAHDLSIR